MNDDRVFLVYCVERGLFGKVAGAKLLGPVFDTQEEAEREMIDLKSKGWDATWISLGRKSRWIVT